VDSVEFACSSPMDTRNEKSYQTETNPCLTVCHCAWGKGIFFYSNKQIYNLKITNKTWQQQKKTA
jgi:hypothetical protein